MDKFENVLMRPIQLKINKDGGRYFSAVVPDVPFDSFLEHVWKCQCRLRAFLKWKYIFQIYLDWCGRSPTCQSAATIKILVHNWYQHLYLMIIIGVQVWTESNAIVFWSLKPHLVKGHSCGHLTFKVWWDTCSTIGLKKKGSTKTWSHMGTLHIWDIKRSEGYWGP